MFQALSLKDGPLRIYLRCPLTDVRLRGFEVDKNTTWVHFAMSGEWEGHPAGPFKFTDEIFEEIIANFRAQDNPVTLTYEHPNAYGMGVPVPAAGRVLDLELRESGLWGLVRFTDRAAEFVRNEEYLYTSVVVDFASTSRESGEEVGAELLQVGLVNDPFLDGQEPIRLSVHDLSRRPASVRKEDTMEDSTKADAADKVELADEVAAEEVVAEEEELAAKDALAALVEEISGMDLPAVIAAIQAKPDEFAALLAGGEAEGMEVESNALSAQAAASETEIVALRSALESLSAKVNELEADKQAALDASKAAEAAALKSSVESVVEGLVKSGRILDAARDEWVKLGVENHAQFVSLSNAIKPAVPTGTLVVSGGPKESSVSKSATSDEVDGLRRALAQAGVRNIDAAVERHLARKSNARV